MPSGTWVSILNKLFVNAERHPSGAPPDSVETSAWVRIWRRGENDEFEIVLDLTTPMPPPTPPPALPQRDD